MRRKERKFTLVNLQNNGYARISRMGIRANMPENQNTIGLLEDIII